MTGILKLEDSQEVQISLKFFEKVPLRTFTIKLPNSASHILYFPLETSENPSQASFRTLTHDSSLSLFSLPLTSPINSSQIHYISLEKLLELLTSFEYQTPEIFNTVLYGYCFFLSEKLLFQHLISRFRLTSPINLAKNEHQLFAKKMLKIIQIKVLIFLQHWFKNQKFSLILQDAHSEELFVELLYLIFNSETAGKWIKDPIYRFFDELEELAFLRNREKNRKKHTFTCFIENFLNKGLSLVRNQRKELAQCFSLFDQRNFEKIAIKELIYKRNLRKDDNRNYYRFIDSFNFLAKFTSFLLVKVAQNYARITLFENIVDFIEELIKLNNFHSSFAVFLGIRNSAILRLKPVLEGKISRNYRIKLEKLGEIFENNKNFREILMKCSLPCVPALSFFTKELSFLEEFFKIKEKNKDEEKMVDFARASKLAEIVKKIELFRTRKYEFSKKYCEEFIRDFECLPNIDEDTLYELSKLVL